MSRQRRRSRVDDGVGLGEGGRPVAVAQAGRRQPLMRPRGPLQSNPQLSSDGSMLP